MSINSGRSAPMKRARSLLTSMAAKAVAVVARPAVESAKIGFVCSNVRPCKENAHSNVTFECGFPGNHRALFPHDDAGNEMLAKMQQAPAQMLAGQALKC